MNRFSRALLASSIALSSMAGTLVASAQPAVSDTTFTSAVAGVDIELANNGMFIADDYAIVEDAGATFEYVLVASDQTDYELAFVDGEYTPDDYLQSTIDLYSGHYTDWELVGQEADADTGWFVANADEKVIYGNYDVDAYGDIDLGYVQFSTADTLEEDTQWALDSISVDAAPIAISASPSDVTARYEGTESASGDDSATEETTTGVTRTTRGSRNASTTDAATEEATEETGTGVTRTTRGSRDATTTETEEVTNETETSNNAAAVEFTSELTGDVVSLGTTGDGSFLEDQYELSRNGTFAEEYIWFTNLSANYELVLVQGDTTPGDYMDLTLGNMNEFYDSWETIDSGSDDTTAWFIAEAVSNGTPLVVYFEYELDAYGDIDLVYMQFSYSEGVQSDLEWVQDNVTIGGEPILTETDAPAVADLLGVSVPDTTDEDPLADDGTAEAADAGDWEALGLVSETEWVSPQYDSSVTWDAETWYFPNDYEYAVISNTDRQYDTVTLQTTDGMGYVYLTIDDSYGNTSQDLVDWYLSPEYAEGITNPITVLDSNVTPTTGGIVYESTNSSGQPILVLVDVQILEDGSAIYTQLTAAPQRLSGVLDQYGSDVMVNGELIELSYTPEDIESLLAD